MPKQVSDLETLCYDAAKAFIQSAVVIDDEAGQLTDDGDVPGATSELVSPTLGATTSETIADEPSRRQPHPLRSKALVETFAGLGVVCGVLQPSDPADDPVDDVLTEAVSRADVVILRLASAGRR